MKEKPILAVCGKGGVGKTAFSALLARALLDGGLRPLLLIDADPAGGLVSALGERAAKGLANVRDDLVRSARGADDSTKDRIAVQLDYMVMEALVERDGWALLAMGRSKNKGCFCPANTLLRQAIDLVSGPFAAVLIDAEAGLEQISREVTRHVTRVVAVTDGSARGADTVAQIAEMVEGKPLGAVVNRSMDDRPPVLPAGVEFLGHVPEDAGVRDHDRQGRPLWELDKDNPARAAVRAVAQRLGLVPA